MAYSNLLGPPQHVHFFHLHHILYHYLELALSKVNCLVVQLGAGPVLGMRCDGPRTGRGRA